MENPLTCNNLKCRKELADRALVTTCSHIFCLDCAHRLGLAGHETPRRTTCPACNSQLANADDAVIANLNPTEEYKTSILSGLSPNIIMECAGRALSFWAYQTTQDIYYQQYLYKTLTDKYSSLSIRLDQTVNDANSEIESLHQKLRSLATGHDTLRRKNEELAQAYRDKSRKLLQTQELYDKVKRKAEMGQIERAASDAVDSTIQAAPQSSAAAVTQGFDRYLPDQIHESGDGFPPFSQGLRFDSVGINTGMPRSNFHQYVDDCRWPKKGSRPQAGVSPTPVEAFRQRVGNQPLLGTPNLPDFAGGSGLATGGSRRQPGTATPSFGQHRGSLAGIGLTSGLKVSQPTNLSGVDASVRSL